MNNPGDASLDSDGDVNLNWEIDGNMLTMSVSKIGRVSYAWLTPGHVEPRGHGEVHMHVAVHEILIKVAESNN